MSSYASLVYSIRTVSSRPFSINRSYISLPFSSMSYCLCPTLDPMLLFFFDSNKAMTSLALQFSFYPPYFSTIISLPLPLLRGLAIKEWGWWVHECPIRSGRILVSERELLWELSLLWYFWETFTSPVALLSILRINSSLFVFSLFSSAWLPLQSLYKHWQIIITLIFIIQWLNFLNF